MAGQGHTSTRRAAKIHKCAVRLAKRRWQINKTSGGKKGATVNKQATVNKHTYF